MATGHAEQQHLTRRAELGGVALKRNCTATHLPVQLRTCTFVIRCKSYVDGACTHQRLATQPVCLMPSGPQCGPADPQVAPASASRLKCWASYSASVPVPAPASCCKLQDGCNSNGAHTFVGRPQREGRLVALAAPGFAPDSVGVPVLPEVTGRAAAAAIRCCCRRRRRRLDDASCCRHLAPALRPNVTTEKTRPADWARLQSEWRFWDALVCYVGPPSHFL